MAKQLSSTAASPVLRPVTLRLPEDMVIAIKVRAAQTRSTTTALVIQALKEAGYGPPDTGPTGRKGTS